MLFTISKPIQEHKLDKQTEVKKLRVTKNNSPISYLDAVFDADQIAKNNINGKIVEIQSKISLGIPYTNLVWKDKDNILHTWDDMQTYLTWLQGLAVAISERNTELYKTSWKKKQDIEDLPNISAVVTYDTKIGW